MSLNEVPVLLEGRTSEIITLGLISPGGGSACNPCEDS